MLAVVALFALLCQGCGNNHTPPQSFASPEEAVQALTGALRAGNVQRLHAIMGSDGREIVESGDPALDRLRYNEFLALYDAKSSLDPAGPDARTLIVGPKDWPFPVPVVQLDGTWFFDAESGKEEILHRRIGEDELSAIQVCKAIGDAQGEYAQSDPDGDGMHDYAQKIASDPGKRNGLFWPTASGQPPSPLGELAASAAAEGYVRRPEGLTPYHGYFFRILRAQGPAAPGGAVDYMVNGKLLLGFAVVAWPAEYDNSGIMTFVMGADGVVYQKDLGEDTANLAAAITTFDPGEGWKRVE
jgi:hypothetical protein